MAAGRGPGDPLGQSGAGDYLRRGPRGRDIEESSLPRRRSARMLVRRAWPPLLVAALVLLAWEALMLAPPGPPAWLPAPSQAWEAWAGNQALFGRALWHSVRLTLTALAAAAALALLVALALELWRPLDAVVLPLGRALRIMPVAALAPLALVGSANATHTALLCAGLAALLPALSGAVAGLRSTRPALSDLYALYGATRWQRWRLLRWPSALPDLVRGLQSAALAAFGGLLVGEFAAAALAATRPGYAAAMHPPGLATYLFEAMQRADLPQLIVLLVLAWLTALALRLACAAAAWVLLGPGRSARRRTA